MTARRTLTIEVRRPDSQFAEVRLLVDGLDELDPSDCELGNEPDDLLKAGALLATETPRRVALYGCDCGAFGCTTITALIANEGDSVTWTDFRNVTGVFYWGPLPLPEDRHVQEAFDNAEPLAISTIEFDADQYLAEVERATKDRSWETRSMEAARLLSAAWQGGYELLTKEGDEGIIVGKWDGHGMERGDLALPAGPLEPAIDRLVALLEIHTPAKISRDSLWK